MTIDVVDPYTQKSATREGRYAADGEEREHVEHGHMPAWAQDDPHAYWQAADAHERAAAVLTLNRVTLTVRGNSSLSSTFFLD